MPDKYGLKWFLRCIGTAALVLVICAVAKPWLPNGMQAPATTVRSTALVAFNRYVSDPVPEVVLLGSSLTARIREDYFDGLNVRNLAIGGGSPLTGLRFLLLDRKRLPKTILVETNLLSKEADEELIDSYSGMRGDQFFRPVRMAVAAYEKWQHTPRNRNETIAAANRLLIEPAQDYDNQAYLDRVVKGYGQDVTAVLQTNVDQLARLVSSAKELGARVLLFELPYADQVDQTRVAQDTRRVALEHFADPREWLNLTIAKSELRWPDGGHFDERSAVLAAKAIEQALSARSKAPP